MRKRKRRKRVGTERLRESRFPGIHPRGTYSILGGVGAVESLLCIYFSR